ncbi:hypothetical protein TraAM80_09852 [Trypanosoma rangeli]|uniref:Uncharacterized protein n=1 Tax=Trypanosoma rangeli TaxID=5698 RepID=A0A422MTB1_TRYRA|nr:uncharacterized protein TraAM80_09852 [Trypanosoma rangeli]RNE96417.1 hypothetical protein TraAM80_09852 [Trypanosoma rangeli]|eukprot:RNE96417.1 hypothetical protein TraAM80_09852 [Trypanosoma rangeli]
MEEVLLQFRSVRPLPRAVDRGGLRLRVRRHPVAHRASRSGRRLPARLNTARERTGGVAGSSSGSAGRPGCSAVVVQCPVPGDASCPRCRWYARVGAGIVPPERVSAASAVRWGEAWPRAVPLHAQTRHCPSVSRRVQWSGWSVFRLKGLALAPGRGGLVLPARGAFLV